MTYDVFGGTLNLTQLLLGYALMLSIHIIIYTE